MFAPGADYHIQVVGATGAQAAATRSRGCTPARTGAGAYTITTSPPASLAEFEPNIQPIVAAGAGSRGNLVSVAAGVWTLTLVDELGAVADTDFFFSLRRRT